MLPAPFAALALLAGLASGDGVPIAPEGREVVAESRFGPVTAADIANWSRFVEIDAGTASRLSVDRKIEEIVILRALARRADERDRSAWEAARREAEIRVRERRLRRVVWDASRPSEIELRAEYPIRRDELRQPPRWRLADIYKAAGVAPEKRAAIRSAMESLRVRLVAGESFAALAQSESESGTRLRGGAAGFVELSRLRPELASVVKNMKPGETTPVIELPNGFVLLRCEDFEPGVDPDFEAAREQLESRLREQRFEASWAEVESRLAAPSDPERRLRSLEAELDRRGSALDADDALWLEWKEGTARAQLAANAFTAARTVEPTNNEVENRYKEAPERWASPRQRLLRALRFELDASTTRSALDAFTSWSARLASGASSLPEAESALRPAVRLEELGWLGDDQVWLLGLNVDAAVAGLKVHERTPLVQEGQTLRVVELVDERPFRQLTMDEARPQIVAILKRERQIASGEDLRRSILADAGIRRTPS